MRYVYSFMNATLAVRVIDHLLSKLDGYIEIVTVIYLIDRWVLNVVTTQSLSSQLAGDFKAFLDENGLPYQPLVNLKAALKDLDHGKTPTEVMNRHQVVIVSHGGPNVHELEMFRRQFIQGLGYCPQSLI